MGSVILSTPKIDWFMKDIKSSTNTYHLRDSIINGTALVVSDGSFLPINRIDACAWIVAYPE